MLEEKQKKAVSFPRSFPMNDRRYYLLLDTGMGSKKISLQEMM
jgi:hypothetical protein